MKQDICLLKRHSHINWICPLERKVYQNSYLSLWPPPEISG